MISWLKKLFEKIDYYYVDMFIGNERVVFEKMPSPIFDDLMNKPLPFGYSIISHIKLKQK